MSLDVGGTVDDRRSAAALVPASGLLEAVLFDLDGTLIPLARGNDRDGALADLARRFWIATETPLNYAATLFERSTPASIVDPVVRCARRLKGIASDADARLIEGSGDALRALSRRFKIAIVTSRSAHASRDILARTGLAPLGPILVSRGDVWRPKPHPGGILLACRRLGVPPAKAAMVGDMAVDARAARRAGALPIGVASGFSTAPELKKAGAHLVFSSVSEVSSWLLAGGGLEGIAAAGHPAA